MNLLVKELFWTAVFAVAAYFSFELWTGPHTPWRLVAFGICLVMMREAAGLPVKTCPCQVARRRL